MGKLTPGTRWTCILTKCQARYSPDIVQISLCDSEKLRQYIYDCLSYLQIINIDLLYAIYAFPGSMKYLVNADDSLPLSLSQFCSSDELFLWVRDRCRSSSFNTLQVFSAYLIQ